MSAVAVFLLVVGCSAGPTDCREIPGYVPFFATTEDCQIQHAGMIDPKTNSHQTVFGACVEIDPSLMEVNAEIVWDVSHKEGLTVEVVPVDETMPILAATQALGGEVARDN